MGQDVVGDDHVGKPSLLPQLPGEALAEERAPRRDSFLLSHSRRPLGRVDPQNGDTRLGEVLEHIAVVAGQFEYEAAWPQLSRSNQTLGVRPSVAQKGRRNGRVLRIVSTEEFLGRYCLENLHEPAVRTERDVQRVLGLGMQQVLLSAQSVCQRCH